MHRRPSIYRWTSMRVKCLPRDRAAVLARVERLVAPRGLYGELVAGERDVLQLEPRALVAVLARLRVVPPVLDAEEVVRVGDRLGVLVAGDDRPAVEDAVAERVARAVHTVHPAALAEPGPVRVLPRDERVLEPVRVPEPVDARRLRVVAAVHGLAGRDRLRPDEDDVRRARVVAEVRRRLDRFLCDRVVDE